MREIIEGALHDLLSDHEKEYACHVEFVRKIGLELAARYNARKDTVDIACLLHDIGRGREIGQEEHEDVSVRIARELIKDIDPVKQGLILACIAHHNNKHPVDTIEERIIICADSGSKVVYHSAFMLMCRKEGHIERAKWGLKYLEKGYKNAGVIPEYQMEIETEYLRLKSVYQQVFGKSD